MIRHELTALVEAGVRKAQEQGLLPDVSLPDSSVEHPQNADHGDYASTLPMKLARSARLNPMSIAEAIVKCLPAHDGIDPPTVALPGFVNFRLKQSWLSAQVDSIVEAGESFGRIDIGHGKRIQVEYVSANPTGPLHVGHGRGAVFGSALSAALIAAGYNVIQEYYINDTGNQIDVFQRSLWARYMQALDRNVPVPEDGYGGEYLADIANELVFEHGAYFTEEPADERKAEMTELGMGRIMETIQRDLEALGVNFDVWFSEAGLYRNGTYDLVLKALTQGGHIADREGARWFVSSALGEDKDNVLVRSTGIPTYFASDAAYHYDKFTNRNFEEVIDVWGADHQGHVSRVKAIIGALGIDSERFQVIITQLVTLKRGDEVVRLSKRTGNTIALSDVIDEVGADACRFVFLSRAGDSQMDFDMELAKKQSNENPVYYVQYAHARIASVLRNAREQGKGWEQGNPALLTHEAELELIRKLLMLPEIVETVAVNREPHHLPHYALELATAFHTFYEQCRIILPEDDALTSARLKLASATMLVLGRTLALMGMSAPARM